MLTTEELQILDLLSEATTKFAELEEHHPTEREDWGYTVHVLQRQIMSRSARRAYPTVFTRMVKKQQD